MGVSTAKRLYLALQDMRRAIQQRRIWLHLGLLEVKQRYRRSIIGPWWISISMLIFIVAMGIVFSRLFTQSLAEYVPFFTAGFFLWSFISTSLNESTDLFKNHSGFIKQLNLPYNLYIFKYLTRNVVILAHNFVVYLLVILFFKLNPGWNVLFAIPGILLLIVNLYWVCLLTALISTRFRDMIPIINSCVQILFFVTPISWMPKLIGQNSIILKFNPLVYFLDIVRQPLLGIQPPLYYWTISLCITAVGLAITLSVFSSVRSRIPFWID